MQTQGMILEVRVPKLFVVEGRGDVVPFLVRVAGTPSAAYLYFVAVDLSWSMNGEAIFVAKAAVSELAKVVGRFSRLYVYGFDRGVRRIAEASGPQDLAELERRICSARLGGGTDIRRLLDHLRGECLRAKEEASRGGSPARAVLVLISDGFPTCGSRKHREIVEAARRLGDCVSASVVLGVGGDVNDRLLEEVSYATGGLYSRVSGVQEARESIERLLPLGRGVSARGVSVRIRPGEGVGVTVYGGRSRSADAEVEVEVGDLHEGEEMDIVGDFAVPPQRRGMVHLGTVYGVYFAEGRQVVLSPTRVSVPCVSQTSIGTPTSDPVYREIAVVKAAVALARDMQVNLSAERLKKAVERLISKTPAADHGNLYSRTIDLRSELEREGLPPQLVDRIVVLLHRVLLGEG